MIAKRKAALWRPFLFGGPEENRFSQARRPLGHRGSDVPPARHSLPLPSRPGVGDNQETNLKPSRRRVQVGKEEQRHERALNFKKIRSKRYKACSDVVTRTGLEPMLPP